MSFSLRNRSLLATIMGHSLERNCLQFANDVLKPEWDVTFEQAENHMHTIKALLAAPLGD